MKKSLLCTIAFTAVVAASSASAVTITQDVTVSGTFQPFYFFVNSLGLFDISANPTFNDLALVLYPAGSSTALAGPSDHFSGISLASGLYNLEYASPMNAGKTTTLTIASVVSTVPVPASLPMLAGGVALIGLFRKKRRMAA